MSNIPEEHKIDDDTVDGYIEKLRKIVDKSQRLEYGPGGIMEMKQTIADKELEIDRLQKYKVFAIMIANEPWELSYEKIEWQRNWWSKLARGLVKELENDDE